MYLGRLGVLLAVGAAVGGCVPSGMSMIRDGQRYDSGQPKSETVGYFLEKDKTTLFGHVSEYYESGRLKSDEWTERGRPIIKLTFYDTGRLRSEERFFNGQLVFGAYYSPAGDIEGSFGQRPVSTAAKKPGK
jgi:hypothetical protein